MTPMAKAQYLLVRKGKSEMCYRTVMYIKERTE